MPSSDEILAQLSWIANEYWLLAVLWHIAIATALVALATRSWEPTRRGAAILLAAPLLSVSALAFGAGNPFNGSMFLGFAVLLVLFGLRLPQETVHVGPRWAAGVGAVVLAYGLVYPHFLVDAPGFMYLIAAPTGLVPCPTLATVIGLGLVAGGFRSRAWSLTVGLAGLFYGVVGVLRLGVWLDLGLLLAAGAMIAVAVRIPRRAVLRAHAPA